MSMFTYQPSSFIPENHIRGPLRARFLSGDQMAMMLAPVNHPYYNKIRAEAGAVTNQAGHLFVFPLTFVQTFTETARNDIRNPQCITPDILQQMAQCASNDDVNDFFSRRYRSGKPFKNAIVATADLCMIPQQEQYGDYGHRFTLFSDYATDPVPRQTQHALDADLDQLAHYFVVRDNFRAESEYTEEDNAALKTYYITSHAALWAFNLTFSGTARPSASRVRLPSQAWLDAPF